MAWIDIDEEEEKKKKKGWVDVEEKEEKGGFLPYLTRGISSAAGLPADAIRGAANLIPGVDIQPEQFGSRAIELGLNRLTGAEIPEQGATPKTLPEHIGRSIGEVAGFAIPGGVALKGIAKGAGMAGQMGRQVLESMGKAPLSTLLGELTAGAGAGTGRFIGEQQFNDPTAQGVAELVGGVMGGAAPAVFGNLPIVAGARMGKQFLESAGSRAKYRAGKFLRSQVADPEKAAREATEKTVGELPHAIATGEERIMGLLRGFRDADTVIDADFIDKTGKSLYKLQNEMRSFGMPDTDIMREITQKRINSLTQRMDSRIKQAEDTAQKKLQQLTPAKRKAEEAIIVRNELESVVKEQSAIKRQKWEEVPRDLTVDINLSRTRYNEILDDLPKAQRGDIPYVLKNSIIAKPPKPELSPILDSKGRAIIAKPETATTVNELWGLRSKLLETSRRAKSMGRFNQARISDEIADALLEDLGAKAGKDMTPGGQKLNEALTFTREFENRFHTGVTGKILGYEKSGAPKISPELTLDVSIGRSGLRGADDVEKVLVTPEARNAAQRYLTRSFTDYATDAKTGALNPIKAQKWMKTNEQLLDSFPELKTTMSDAQHAQDLASQTRTLMEARKVKIQDPNISYASKFLNTEVGSEISTIMKSKNPSRMTGELMRQAGKDPRAREGLKGAFVSDILDKSAVGKYNDLGEKTLSGKAMNAYMNDNIDVFRQVFSQDEIVRMRKIANELAKLEKSEGLTKGMGTDFEDTTSNLLQTMGRLSGAQIGRKIAKLTGGGTVQTPGIVSERFKKFIAKFTKSRTDQVLQDAVLRDPELFRTLMFPIDKPSLGWRNIKAIDRKMNLWLAGSGKRVMDDILEEIEEDKQGGSR